MLEKFSAGAIQALNAAREEALRLEFNEVDTDHLLLGLAHEHKGLLNQLLTQRKLASRHVRLAVEQVSGRGYSMARQEDLVFSSGTLRVLARTCSDRPTLVESQDLFFALLSEPDTAALAVLRQLGLEPDALRADAEATLGRRRLDEAETPAEEAIVLPRRFVPRLLTPAGADVLAAAHDAARLFGHTFVGTEQLLTALLASPALAGRTLREHGIDPLAVEAVASRVIGQGSGTLSGKLSLSRWCDEVLDHAWILARKQQHAQVGTGHILLGLIGLDVCGALSILDQLDVNLEQIRYDVESAFLAAPNDPEPAPP